MTEPSQIQFVHYLPIATTGIAAAFTASLWRRYRQRRTPHLWWWAVGVAFYGLGTLIEATITLAGNTVLLTKAWYIAGAVLGGYPLAQGSLYFSYSRRFANRVTAISLPVVIVTAVLVAISPVLSEHLQPHRPSGAILGWQWVRLLTPFINAYAAFFLIGGAVVSAWRYARLEHAGNRAAGNSLIAFGALLPGIGGSMAKAGIVEALYVGEFIGLIFIWIGERVCAWRGVGGPETAGLTASPSPESRAPSPDSGVPMRIIRLLTLAAAILSLSTVAGAATIAGTASDPSGGPVANATVTLLNIATGAQFTVEADAEGRFRFESLAVGIYRVAVERSGFSEEARTVSIAEASETLELRFILRPGGLTSEVTVTATRSERDARLVPLRTDSLDERELQPLNPVSTGDALVQAPGVTPVSSGPYLLRPRLRGLDSTRLLVLVDGERLNNARTATDRAGTEVGLVDLGSVSSMEIVSGSGSVLYGTDALSGTINIITNQPQLADSLRFTYGFDGYYSSNETGRRGTVTLGARAPRWSVQFIGSMEQYDAYEAGGDATNEDTFPLHEQGVLTQADTIDDNFGFNFNAFPEPFNAPYVRTGTSVPVSASKGNSINAAGLFAITDTQTLSVKYIRRRADDIGFPDFEQPYFFQRVTLPYSNLDRLSARYEARSITPWFTNLRVSGYVQDQKRLLRNDFPVQFPVPSPRFFPISVYRLNILSDTEQHVSTPGFDVQGTFLAGRKHVITAGATIYRDRSQDTRVSTTETTVIGDVTLGARGPQANVYPTPIVLGQPVVTNPVRVPDASFRDIGVFVQDEWEVGRQLRLVLGLRADSYRVRTDATPGYDVGPLIAGANPPIDPEALPNPLGDSVSRGALTGDVGAVFRVNDAVNVIGHYGRSYRHANLEELLFAGPATVGTIVPNLLVEPEKGHNVDVGVRMRTNAYAASVTYFNNIFDGFISTEITSTSAVGPISQAINFADVRIQGVEADGQVPLAFRRGVVTLYGNAAFTRGTVLEGTNPFTGASLDGTPQDNITPFKSIFGVRFNDVRDRYWVEYGARAQAEVERVATTVLESPYLIAQDLLSLDGFVVQRIAGGLNFQRGVNRLALVLAVENLTDRYYREQFQFAPARGRSFTVGISLKGI